MAGFVWAAGGRGRARRGRPRPARIAMVAPSLDILGGQGVQAALLAEALRAEGRDVRLVPVNPAFPRPLAWLRRYRGLRTLVNEALYLPGLIRLARADVAHVFSASYWSFLLAPVPAMLAGRLFGCRVVLHYHSGEAGDHLERWGWLVHPWLRLAHEIVVPSAWLAAVFSRFGYRTRVIANIVDVSRFIHRERHAIRPRLLSNRNLEPHYGVDTVIRAFQLVRARHPEATLTVAGAGSDRSRLEALVAGLGLAGVRFVGRVEPDAMPALLDAADVFVNASVVDNQPVSILEAFAAGLPVVTTPTGDISRMVSDGTTGLLVPPGDAAAVASAVVSLVGRPGLGAALARRARRELAAYAWPAVRAAWNASYRAAGGIPVRRSRPARAGLPGGPRIAGGRSWSERS